MSTAFSYSVVVRDVSMNFHRCITMISQVSAGLRYGDWITGTPLRRLDYWNSSRTEFIATDPCPCTCKTTPMHIIQAVFAYYYMYKQSYQTITKLHHTGLYIILILTTFISQFTSGNS